MADYLGRFIRDKATSETVYEWLLSELDKAALKAVYSKEETKHFAEVKKVVEKAFFDARNEYKEKDSVMLPTKK